MDLLVPGFTTPYTSSEADTSDQGDNDDDGGGDVSEEEEDGDDDDDDDDNERADDGDRPACEPTAATDSTVAKKKAQSTYDFSHLL